MKESLFVLTAFGGKCVCHPQFTNHTQYITVYHTQKLGQQLCQLEQKNVYKMVYYELFIYIEISFGEKSTTVTFYYSEKKL